MTFGRVPLGPSDFSLTYYSYDDTVGDVNMTNFALTTFETETRVRNIITVTNTRVFAVIQIPRPV